MYLAPLNYDRFFKKVFSDPEIAKKFLEDFLDETIEEFEMLNGQHRITDDTRIVEFDYRCKIKGAYVIIDMQQWYKRDIGQRYYLYHALNTGLQLEKLPDKNLITDRDTLTLKEVKDYRSLEPVMTLIWMAADNMHLKENYVSYCMTPELVVDFIRNNKLWRKPDIIELLKERASILDVLHNKNKGMSFLSLNRLIFLLQRNIVKNKPHTRYERWFTFAERTRNDKNNEQDFEEYKNDPIFSEIMRRLNHNELKPDDIVYIADEKKLWEGVERLERGFYEDGKKEGIAIGIEEVKREGIKLKSLTIAKELLNNGISIDIIIKTTGLTQEEIIALKCP
ncbi:MAG: hypothetical protein ACM3SY_05070 [Candidatus Omnitrophota bacterium]